MKIKTLVWAFVAVLSFVVFMYFPSVMFPLAKYNPSVGFIIAIVLNIAFWSFIFSLGKIVLNCISRKKQHLTIKTKISVWVFVVIVSFSIIMFPSMRYPLEARQLNILTIATSIALVSLIFSWGMIVYNYISRKKPPSSPTSNPQEKL